MPFLNKSEATKRSRDRKENGKSTNATNCRSRVGLSTSFYHETHETTKPMKPRTLRNMGPMTPYDSFTYIREPLICIYSCSVTLSSNHVLCLVLVLYLVPSPGLQSAVRSPQSAVRSPSFILTVKATVPSKDENPYFPVMSLDKGHKG